jgi:hypothetical protein
VHLNSVPELGRLVSQVPQLLHSVDPLLLLGKSILVLLLGVLAVVLALEEVGVSRSHDESHEDETQVDTVSEVVVGRVDRPVDVTSTDTTEVSDSLDRNRQ